MGYNSKLICVTYLFKGVLLSLNSDYLSSCLMQNLAMLNILLLEESLVLQVNWFIHSSDDVA
jgi:hypothetical protein